MQNRALFRQAFELARSDFVSFKDGTGLKDLEQGGRYLFFPLIHSERGGLEHEDIFVLIADEPAELVAFGIYHAK